MFSGIIEDIGQITAMTDLEDAVQLRIATKVLEGTKLGDSIAVNGVCLTVTQLYEDAFDADVMQESLDRSALGQLAVGSKVNIERAMRADARLDGHIVQGHVDATATLLSRTSNPHWEVLRFAYPAHLAALIVEKGSIAVNGTSLTVSGLGDGNPDAVAENSATQSWFEVSLIPTTLAETTLDEVKEGEHVNIEMDILGKYAQRYFQVHGVGATTSEKTRSK
ncbi:MAG: riboflavin synthase [Corynebacterium sp.]|nr:riboflavin synthase [Corynebacterium sp.]